MEIWKWVFVGVIWYAGLVLSIGAVELGMSQRTERISGWFFFKLFLVKVYKFLLGLSCFMLFGVLYSSQLISR
jgi:hypothetical protein